MTPTEQEYVKAVYYTWKMHTITMYNHILRNKSEQRREIDRKVNYTTWRLFYNTAKQYDLIDPNKSDINSKYKKLFELIEGVANDTD